MYVYQWVTGKNIIIKVNFQDCILANTLNSADPNEMPHSVVFHQDLLCLPNNLNLGNTQSMIDNTLHCCILCYVWVYFCFQQFFSHIMMASHHMGLDATKPVLGGV